MIPGRRGSVYDTMAVRNVGGHSSAQEDTATRAENSLHGSDSPVWECQRSHVKRTID